MILNERPQEEIDKLCRLGLAVVETEAAAIHALGRRINGDFARACGFMLECRGRVVVTGMGKSGHIGSKIAATLASTGTPAFFVHPGEASHGDLGMIVPGDVVVALSNSGETGEITAILPLIKRMGVPLISMTGNASSTLATEADVNLDVSVEKEACPLGLAPTASTTTALVMGDALAVALLEARGFTAEDFALSHPGGSLGRRLLLHVADIMHSGEQIPRVTADAGRATDARNRAQSGRLVTSIRAVGDAIALVDERNALPVTAGELGSIAGHRATDAGSASESGSTTEPGSPTKSGSAAESGSAAQAHGVTADTL